MPTVKLVVIGASGVGKTSLRGQYISGRFSHGYRATIGADFITKTLPHPSNPADTVILQIWDTAGQERFSSLSTAFFRGADAALLMFDVNTPATMTALTKWWAEFRERAPLADEDVQDYCCVVVGNKTDLVKSGGAGRNGNGEALGQEEGPTTEEEAHRFVRKLVPITSRSPSPVYAFPLLDEQPPPDEDAADASEEDPPASSQVIVRPASPPQSPQLTPSQTRSNSIAIVPNNNHGHYPSLSHSYSPKHHLSKSRSRSASRFYGGTMTTTHTTHTIYHTPSSSLFDVYQSARSSPEPWSSSPSASTNPSFRTRRLTTLSNGSASSSSAATITPSLFAREHEHENEHTSTPALASASGLANPSALSTSSLPDLNPDSDPDLDPTLHPFATPLPPPPARGPKLFFTSARTGAGVSEVFEYIAQRVVRRWEYEERVEARRMYVREASGVGAGVGAGETIKLGVGLGWAEKGACCGT